jgi:hypothetical protein
MPVTLDNLEDVFTYHPPSEEQAQAYVQIREAAKNMAKTILLNTKPSADQQAALRQVREATQMANACVALRGAV